MRMEAAQTKEELFKIQQDLMLYGDQAAHQQNIEFIHSFSSNHFS